jgi:hypothetical protein
MGQLPNLQTAAIHGRTANVTVEDLKHFFLEAKNLGVFKIITAREWGGGPAQEQLVTREMTEEALALAVAELKHRNDGRRTLDIDIQVE